jgi:hypothetical protein
LTIIYYIFSEKKNRGKELKDWILRNEIPSIREVVIGGSVQGQPRKEVSTNLSQKTRQVWWSILIIPATWEVEIGQLWFEPSQGKNVSKTYLKNRTRCGRACLSSQRHWRNR